jgi:hypothetical protein
MKISFQKLGCFLGIYSLCYYSVAYVSGWTENLGENSVKFLFFACVIILFWYDWIKSAAAR